MPHLVAPTADVHASYLAGLEEFRAEGRLGPDDPTALAAEARSVPSLKDPNTSHAYRVAVLLDPTDVSAGTFGILATSAGDPATP